MVAEADEPPTRTLSASTPSNRPQSSISWYARPLARVDGMDGLCYWLQEIIRFTFLWRSNLAIICGILQRFAAFCGILQHFAAFCSVLRRFATFYGVLQRFAVFCGVLRCFVVFCSILWRVGDKCPLRDQIFGGAQTPAPFSGRLKIIVPKWGGSGPLSPLKTFFLVSSSVSVVHFYPTF